MAQGSSNPTTDLKKVGGTAVDTNTGNASAGTQRVVLASNQPTVPVQLVTGSAAIGTVELGATSLAALENISVTVPGTVDLGTVSLTALETITVVQSLGTAATRWYTQLSDGTNSPSIKAASTAALAADPSLVVGLSPNSPLPAGTNAIGKLTANTGVTIGAVEIAASQTLGTVTTVSTVTNLAQLGGQAISMGSGVRAGGTQRVTIATDDVINLAADDVHDGAAGTTAVMLSGYASSATPTAVSADGDAARLWVNRSGALITDSYAKIGTATALGALNANMVIALGGATSVGLTVTAISTPVGMVLTPYVSFDGGTNYIAVTFDNPAGDKTSTMTNAELVAGAMRTVMLAGGATHVKVQATSWTSGSVTINLSATNTADSSVFFAASNNTANRPPATAQVGGWDGTNLRALSTNASGHLAIQDGGNSITVDGTVAATQSGTWNIGTVTTLTGITNALPAGTNAIGKLAANSGVDIGDVDVLSIVPGTAATNLGKAVDSVAGATDTGVMALAVRDDALATLTPVDGDYTQLRVTSQGRLWTSATIDAALPAGTNAIGSITNTTFASTQSGTWTVGLSAGSAAIGTVEIGATSLAALETISAAQSGTWTVQPGNTANTTPWLTRLSDGTNSVAIKAASTAAAAADPALVVAISPNNTVPVSIASVPSHAVTNAGTFAVQVTSAPTTAVTGTFWQATQPVSIAALPALATGTNTIGAVNQGTAAVVANSWYMKLSDGTNGPVAVKAAGIRPTTSDPSLVVQIAPQNEVRIRPSEVMRDAVDKLRVSTPQSLIDTDFEYGIQPTKWESVSLLNNRATAFVDVTIPVTGITNITASAKVVTVTGTGFSLVVGQPIFITGTLDTSNVDGWWIVDTVTSTTSFTFLVNTAPAASLFDATKTYIYGGTFFTGSNIVLDSAQTLTSVVISGTAGTFTCAAATLAVGDMIRISGTFGGTGSITGYVDPTIYYIITTNGTTSFTLSATPGGAAVTTVAGTPTGITVVNTSIAVSGTTVTVRTSNDHGLRPGNKIYMTGTTGVTGGPVNGTWQIASVPTNNIFRYTTNATATGAITYTPTTTLYPAQPGYVDHRPYDGGVQFSNETAYHGYQDIRQTRRYFRYQSGKGIQFSTGTILKPPFYVDQVTSSGTTVTVTTKYPHGLLTGSTVVVSGASPAPYNGTFTVTGTTTLTITYTALSAPGTTPATGFPITVSPGTWYGGSNRIGMFDNQNGFFYEHDGQTMYAVLRKSVDQISGRSVVTANSQLVTGTGTFYSSQLKPGDNIVIRGMTYRVQIITNDTTMYIYPEYRGVTSSNCVVTKTVETRIAQSSWNIDRCNGAGGTTNPSGFNLDLTRMQMFYMDYSWYGAGAVRFGFKDQNGEIIVAHRITNSNINYEAYMRSGNLPARYETNTLAPRTHLTVTLAAATTTGGTITVADTSLFPPTGTIAIYQPQHQGGAIEYITYTAKTATTFTIGARVQSLGIATAQTFTYSATAPIYVEAYVPQAAQTLSHWGSSVIMDGRYDDDKSLVFNAGMTTAITNKAINTRVPLLSLRLAPTVDNGLTGLLGAREIINRMQLTLRSIGTYTSGSAYRIEILLNPRVSAGQFVQVGGSSLSQICYHAGTETVTGGESMFAFYATANDTNSMDLDQVRDLGNSILGGGTTAAFPTTNLNKYPDGPDIITVIAIPLTNATNTILARLNWSEAQA